MAYIRIKKISNNQYAYLVENINTSIGPRQKVKEYLGKVITLPISQTKTRFREKDLLVELILQVLIPFGFQKKQKTYHAKQIIFNPVDLTIHSIKNKPVLIPANNGYLSSFTLQRIKQFQKGKDLDNDAHLLAKYFLEAGLRISEENFVNFYQQLK
jgi:hypothetical protein